MILTRRNGSCAKQRVLRRLIYDQECAANLRRKRRRGIAETPNTRIFINEAVCEGCGDCGRISNCLSVQPVQTEFGRKTQIHQSSCNLDYSCMEGDCPAFVRVEAEQVEKKPSRPFTLDSSLPEPPANDCGALQCSDGRHWWHRRRYHQPDIWGRRRCWPVFPHPQPGPDRPQPEGRAGRFQFEDHARSQRGDWQGLGLARRMSTWCTICWPGSPWRI